MADLVLAPVQLGSVSGSVSDTGGVPVPGTLLTLQGPDDTTFQARTDEDGGYTFPGLLPGDYAVRVTAPDGATVVGDEELTVTLTEAEEDVTGLDFLIELPEQPVTYTASGTVLDQDGDAVPDTTVLIDGEDVEQQGIPVDEAGEFTAVGLPDGDYTATVDPPGGYTVDEDPLEFTIEGEDQPGLDFVLTLRDAEPETHAASGSVRDQDGGRVPDTTVVIQGEGGEQQEVPVDEDGDFTAEGLLDGDYTAVAEGPEGYQSPDPEPFTISGDDLTGLAIVLVAVPVEPEPEPSPAPAPSPGASPRPSAQPTADDPVPPGDHADPVDGGPAHPGGPGPDHPAGTGPDGSGDLADTGGPAAPLGALGLLTATAGTLLLRGARSHRD